MSLPEAKFDELSTVEANVETWKDFIEASVNSNFYKTAYAATKNVKQAAALTLLNQYINIFEEPIRKEILSNVEVFYSYAQGFFEELVLYRYNPKGYDVHIRTLYLGKIRELLRHHKTPEGNIVDPEHYEFTRTLIRFLSSFDYIISTYDLYKEYCFRILPQYLHNTGI